MRHTRFPGGGVELIAGLAITLAAATSSAAPPQVVESIPANGARDVDPAVREIRVTFDQDMNRGGYSWVGGGPQYPTTRGKARWVNARTCVLPVRLVPNHTYILSINSSTFQNFRSKSGEPAVPYPLSFKTGARKAATTAEADVPRDAEEATVPDVEPLEFALHDTFGREIRSKDYAGVPLAIMCGACWCGGCQQDAQPFADLASRFSPRGLQFIRSVSGDNDLTSLDFQKHYRLPMVNLLDPNRTFEKSYNEDGWTFIMLVDRSGNVVYRANNPSFPSLVPRLENLLSHPVENKPIVRDGVPYMRATLERTGEIDKARTCDAFPCLIAGPQGRMYLVFNSNRRGNSDIFLRVYDGKAWSADQPVAATEADEYDATVVVDSRHRAWISWTGNAGGGKYNVFVTSLDASDKPAAPTQLTHADDDAMHARMACDAKGAVWCTYYRWHKMGRFSRDKEVYVCRYDGTEWSPQTRLSPANVPTYEDHTDPVAAAYGEGVLIGWIWDYHQPKGYTKEAANPSVFLRPIGENLKPGPLVHASGRSIDGAPAVAVDGKYRVWCAWDALDWDDRLRAERKSVRVCRRDLSAARPQPAQALSPNVVNVCTPDLAVSPKGTVTAVWGQNDQGDRWALQQADYDVEEAKWSAARVVESEGNPRFPSAVYDAAGTLWVAYSTQSEAGRQIRVKAIKPESR